MANSVLLRIAFWVGIIGFVLSLATHIAALTGYPIPDAALGLHVGVFVAFVPVIFGLKAWVEERGYDFNDFRGQWAGLRELLGGTPGWEKLCLGALFVYAMVNFLVGFAAVVGAPDAGFSYRLFSGHWLFFYFISAVFARRLLVLRQQVAPPREV